MADPVTGVAAGVAPKAPPPPSQRDQEMLESAKAFEAVFIAQMLSQTGLGEALSTESGFGGEAFSGFLVEQYANRLVEQGGFGLAEKIYQQLRQQSVSNADTTKL